MAVKPVPEGYHTATPYLIVSSAARALDFYKEAFEATETFRMTGPNGKVVHAEIKIGDSPIMLADEMPGSEFHSTKSGNASAVSIMLYVENVDVRFTKATRAGAKTLRAVENQFYGDRAGTLQDPFGHIWTIATHKEDVSPEEINKRAATLFKNQSSA